MTVPSDIASRRASILDDIAASARAAGREPTDITLVAVSKRQSGTRLDAALKSGQRVFGENRVQEAQQHWQTRREACPGLELRLIGPLQTNKAADAVALFDVIETLDRERLARALRKAMDEQGRSPRLYVQVNTGEENQKAGIAPADLPDFLDLMRGQYGFAIEGLMCIPPVEEPAGLHFSLLARLARENGVSRLSMGMSADYQTAIALGATSVRVGTAFFGERDGA
jgi:hypothetical protein